jgi:predicted nucleic acid-binding protein
MSRVFWDTNIFIYLFESYGELSEQAAELRRKMLARSDRLLTSALTLGEILVKPTEQHDLELCRRYEEAILATSQVLPFDTKAAKNYATLRCDRSLRAPDALQLACASAAGVDLFVTNNSRLQNKRVEGIQFIVSLDRVPM